MIDFDSVIRFHDDKQYIIHEITERVAQLEKAIRHGYMFFVAFSSYLRLRRNTKCVDVHYTDGEIIIDLQDRDFFHVLSISQNDLQLEVFAGTRNTCEVAGKLLEVELKRLKKAGASDIQYSLKFEYETV